MSALTRVFWCPSDFETELKLSIELVNARRCAERALCEPRNRFRKYKTKHALERLERIHAACASHSG